MMSAERLMCSALNGHVLEWQGSHDSDETSRFIERLRYHGLATLLERALAGSEKRGSWPATVLDYCRAQTLSQAVAEMAGRAELARVLQGLAQAGIKALLLKGGALAYSHYANPVLRPRGDTDLLVPRSSRGGAEAALRRLGYAPALQVSGEFASYQASWSFIDAIGVSHEIDLHWRIHNSQVLATLLDYDELAEAAMPLPGLGAHAYALIPVHALLFACLHSAGHRNAPYYMDGVALPASGRLIWLYDIHLLVSGMSPAELEEFAALAGRKRMKSICRDALERSAECFQTRVPQALLQQLSRAGPVEPSERYCGAGLARQMLDDFVALEGIGARARWLGEHTFPPAAYMRGRYTDSPHSWLPLLYARRALNGCRKLFISSRLQ